MTLQRQELREIKALSSTVVEIRDVGARALLTPFEAELDSDHSPVHLTQRRSACRKVPFLLFYALKFSGRGNHGRQRLLKGIDWALRSSPALPADKSKASSYLWTWNTTQLGPRPRTDPVTHTPEVQIWQHLSLSWTSGNQGIPEGAFSRMTNLIEASNAQ